MATELYWPTLPALSTVVRVAAALLARELAPIAIHSGLVLPPFPLEVAEHAF